MRWSDYWQMLERVSTRYFLVAGIFFICYYVFWRNRLRYRKIQNRFPKLKDYQREIGYSILTMIIFAAVPFLIVKNPLVVRHTRYYTGIAERGWLYFILALPLMFLIHDAYFYWTHRLMHHKKLFPLFHRAHHQSVNPSPWAAYSFHPLEALVEAGIFPVFLFAIPIHPLHLLIFFFFMILYNVYGHLGYELYPRWFNRHAIGKWINTSVSHNLHHQYFKGNYSLYFTFWDRAMGTLRKDYDQRFEELGARTRKTID
jgi:Delta7-sterol 5-desaturase